MDTELANIDFNTYQVRSRKTANYPNMGESAVYPAMGLAGEAGEVCDKIKKMWRNTQNTDPKKMPVEFQSDLILELGDTLWYCAAVASEMGVTLQDVAKHNILKLEDRHSRNVICGEGDRR